MLSRWANTVPLLRVWRSTTIRWLTTEFCVSCPKSNKNNVLIRFGWNGLDRAAADNPWSQPGPHLLVKILTHALSSSLLLSTYLQTPLGLKIKVGKWFGEQILNGLILSSFLLFKSDPWEPWRAVHESGRILVSWQWWWWWWWWWWQNQKKGQTNGNPSSYAKIACNANNAYVWREEETNVDSCSLLKLWVKGVQY